MMRKDCRWFTALLALCLSSSGTTSCRDRGSAPTAVGSASTPISRPKARLVASASPSALPAAPLDLVFSTFFDATLEACQPKSEPMTTAEMVAFANRTTECLERKVKTAVRRLDHAKRARLLLPNEQRRTLAIQKKHDWHPAWNRLVSALCFLDDAAEWIHEEPGAHPQRGFGTIAYVSRASCMNIPLPLALYQVEAYAEGGARRFANHVRARAPLGERQRRRLETWRAKIDRFSRVATEGATPDHGCHGCTLSDADWFHIAQNMEVVEHGARVLASALLGAWPELATELSGSMRAQGPVETYYLASKQ